MKGIAIDAQAPRAIENLEDRMQTIDIIIRVGDMDGEILEHLPFHTSAFRWEAAEPGDDADEEQIAQTLKDNYRLLSLKLEDLMQTLIGGDAG